MSALFRPSRCSRVFNLCILPFLSFTHAKHRSLPHPLSRFQIGEVNAAIIGSAIENNEVTPSVFRRAGDSNTELLLVTLQYVIKAALISKPFFVFFMLKNYRPSLEVRP